MSIQIHVLCITNINKVEGYLHKKFIQLTNVKISIKCDIDVFEEEK